MASPGNRHCANCVGALSFPTAFPPHVCLFSQFVCFQVFLCVRETWLT